MIRVLVVDDHPLMRTGLRAVLRSEPGLGSVGAADSVETAVAEARSLSPDVVVCDVNMPDGGGMVATWRLKSQPDPPRVLLFTAFATERLLVPALVAGADDVVCKETGADALFESIRRVHGKGCVLDKPDPAVIRAAMERVDPEDQPVVSMLVSGTTPAELAAILRTPLDEMGQRVERILGRLLIDA